jgi:hypothetical protein
MRLHRVQFTVVWIMAVVAAIALLLPWAIYLWQIDQNWRAYSRWVNNRSPNRPRTYEVPYPRAGAWPYPYPPREAPSRNR